MKHIIFEKNSKYSTAILIKESAFREKELKKNYVNYLTNKGIPLNEIIAFDLPYFGNKKPKAKEAKDYLKNLLNGLTKIGVKNLLVCDGEYFKLLTKVKKVDPSYGYNIPSTTDLCETEFNCVITPNYQALIYNPDLQVKVDTGLNTLLDIINNKYVEPGKGIIKKATYIDGKNTNKDKIRNYFKELHNHPALSVDTETFGLKVWDGIGTIAFAWNKHEGMAFRYAYTPHPYPSASGFYGHQRKGLYANFMKECLKDFFLTYKGKLIFHNANFDMKIIIWEIFMEDPLDYKGMHEGINTLTQDFDDTKIIAYLTTNSCAGNNLKLKALSHDFAGNYAQDDIDDITLIPLPDLLQYNLVDCLATHYVRDKYFLKLVQDKQLKVYEEIFKPSVKVILQMELTGMPLHMEHVRYADAKLTTIISELKHNINATPIIQKFTKFLRNKESIKKHLEWKQKKKSIDYFDYIEFNPGSNPQLQDLFYEFLKLPVIDLTDKKQPATGAKTIKKLVNHTKDKDIIELLTNIKELGEATKIKSTFISAFLNYSLKKSDGVYYLHGNFNLGGTVSGRLSSSGPNLQNIPSTGTQYAKLVKQCFIAPPGYVMVGADFASLEDRISALTTKDPNKLKVYIGHTIYELTINGTYHHIRDDAIVNFDGKKYTGEEFYELYKNC